MIKMIKRIEEALRNFSVEPQECRYEALILQKECPCDETLKNRSFEEKTIDSDVYFIDREGMKEIVRLFVDLSDEVFEPFERKGCKFFVQVSVYFNDRENGNHLEIAL